MTTRIELEERVARGAAVLDVCDSDWWRSVDRRTLNISSCCSCTVGQWNCGGYNAGLKKLGIAPKEAYDHGFNGGRFEIPVLNELWDEAISLRELMASVSMTGERELVAAG